MRDIHTSIHPSIHPRLCHQINHSPHNLIIYNGEEVLTFAGEKMSSRSSLTESIHPTHLPVYYRPFIIRKHWGDRRVWITILFFLWRQRSVVLVD